MKKKIVIHAISLVLALLMAVTGIYAWFAMNKDAAGSGVGIAVNTQDVLVYDPMVYRYDKEMGAEVVETLSSIKMSEYDIVFSDRNAENPIYLELPLTGTDIMAGNAFTVSLICDGDYLDENDLVEKNLSNIVSVKYCIKYSKNGISYEELQRTNFSNELLFVNNSIKNNTINFQVNGFTPSAQIYLYIKMDYNSGLVNKYIDDHKEENQSTLSFIANKIEFNGDIKMISIRGTNE